MQLMFLTKMVSRQPYCIVRSLIPLPLRRLIWRPLNQKTSKCEVGWSDHTVNEGVIQRAGHIWSAAGIEFHLDIEGEGSEYKNGHCWLPSEIAPVIRSVRDALKADGDGIKIPTEFPGDRR